MLKPGGYARAEYDDGRIVESDTATCRHCNTIFHVGPKQSATDIGGFCAVCSGIVCAKCVGGWCDEIQRKLDRWEASYHARRSYGLAG